MSVLEVVQSSDFRPVLSWNSLLAWSRKKVNVPVMSRNWVKVLAAILMVPDLALAQATSSPDFTLHINVNLVQVDAVVTDAKNHPITNLKAEDFTILQDGKPQPITNFSFVRVADDSEPEKQVKRRKDPLEAPAPPRLLKLNEVHRVVSLVVDDLGLSFESTAAVHSALKKFVDEQMQPHDLVAIIRTGAGVGALQQFTSDKRLLYAAIDRVRFNPMGRGGISSFAPRESIALTNPSLEASAQTGQSQYGRSGNPASGPLESQYGRNSASQSPDGDEEKSLQEMYSAGTLGAVRFVVEGLRYVPGRKCIILFSENMAMSNAPLVVEGLRRLTDAAERSSVIIYTVDPRGLPTLEPNAADETSRMASSQLVSLHTQRWQQYRESQDGLSFLARETGGLFLQDSNDLPGALQQVMSDSSGYYLIGYHPAAGTFDPVTGDRKFHTLKLVVKTPGYHVRTREGFFGFGDSDPKLTLERPANQMARALAMPFSSSDVHLRLTTLFFNGEKGPYIRSLAHADAKDLTFSKLPDGTYSAQVDILAALFGDNGQIVASSEHSRTLRAAPGQYDEVMRNGFILSDQLSIKKPGAYQMRLVLRDSSSRKVGSASQCIEIPELKNHLTLSSILVKEYSPDDLSSGNTSAEKASEAPDARGNVAVRTFKPGATITYVYEVLNAASQRNGSPEVAAQVRLFRDGKQFFAGQPTPINPSGQADPLRLMAGGVIQLGPQFAPGDYILQVVVTDKLNPKSKWRTSTQWMDFEVGQ